jgi:hypothetical protein
MQSWCWSARALSCEGPWWKLKTRPAWPFVNQSDPKPGKPLGCKMSNRAHDKLAGTIGKS